MAALKLFWDSVQNAVSYNIYWKLSPAVTINDNIIPNIINIYYRHTNLINTTTYYYAVAAVDKNGIIGPLSIEFSAITES